MSNPMTDKMNDWIQDHELELLSEYLEEDKHYLDFTNWLFDKAQDTLREDLFSQFLHSYTSRECKEAERFYDWATQRAASEFEGPEDNPAEDR